MFTALAALTPDKAEVEKACEEIRSYPPLIFAGECRNLQERLAKAATGEAFILQGGDCAEAFTQFSANRIRWEGGQKQAVAAAASSAYQRVWSGSSAARVTCSVGLGNTHNLGLSVLHACMSKSPGSSNRMPAADGEGVQCV